MADDEPRRSIWRAAHEIVRWRGTDAPQYVAQKAAEACDEQAWAFWLEVERAVKELLTEQNLGRQLH